MTLLEVTDLTVNFYTQEGVVSAVDGLSFSIERGETFGIVGESGAGKSVSALSLLRLIDQPGRIEHGEILLDGEDVMEMTPAERRSVRGNRMAMIFQDAQTALNPVYPVGDQIAEAMRHHLDYGDERAREETIELLDTVGIPDAGSRYAAYPHHFSGGMQQRVVIAMALSCDPDLLIADEPTTALDVMTEAKILDELVDLAAEFDTAVQLITHDLGVIAEVCDRVMVMYAGQEVETAPVDELFYAPKHPYTVGLMASIPRLGGDDQLETISGTMPDMIEVPSGCRFHPRCPYAEEVCSLKEPPLADPEPETDTDRTARCLAYTGDLSQPLSYTVSVESDPAIGRVAETVAQPPGRQPILEATGLTKHYETGGSVVDAILGRTKRVEAVEDVDLALYPGETLGVVGESGCGKTTLGRTLLRLVEPTAGSVTYRPDPGTSGREIEITNLSSSALRGLRKDIQYIFQDPFSSLDPRLTVGDIVGEPLDVHDLATGRERTERIQELLETVGLNPGHAHRYPHEFSGGQRQRIGIARALAVDPEVIVCDEPVSALDVSVQAQILTLLEELQAEYDLSYIFIAHDLSVVEYISDRVAVMYLGKLAEVGPTAELFANPSHPYTEALLSVIPEPDPRWETEKILLEGEVPSSIDPPDGCRFHTRCHRVIPPDGLDLDQSTWRSILDLKLASREADSVSELVSQGPAGTYRGELDEGDRQTIEEALREAFCIPQDLSDHDAADALSEAVDALHTDGPEAAAEQLEDRFVSPCETIKPELYDVDGSQQAACLLHDDRFSGADIGVSGGSSGMAETASDGGEIPGDSGEAASDGGEAASDGGEAASDDGEAASDDGETANEDPEPGDEKAGADD